jgi:1-acyl-sn-glycerol-3-phosphate acyltransferase
MPEEHSSELTSKIDIDKVLHDKNPGLYKILPRFLLSYLKKIIHQRELNIFLERYGHLRDIEFIEAGLNYLGISARVYGKENIPRSGRFIFVSNHPLGGLDGLVFINEVAEIYPDLRFPVNDILLNIENLSGIFLPVNKHGPQGREAAARIEEAYASRSQILYFPAGLCSRKKNGVIKDLQWQKSFITKAVQYQRDIIPAYFSGRNSEFFYNLANFRKLTGLKANIEMVYLPDEMFRQKDKDIRLVFGKAIPWESFDKSRKSVEWADWVRSKCYELESVEAFRPENKKKA